MKVNREQAATYSSRHWFRRRFLWQQRIRGTPYLFFVPRNRRSAGGQNKKREALLRD